MNVNIICKHKFLTTCTKKNNWLEMSKCMVFVFVKVNLQDYDKTPKPVCAQTLKMVTGMFPPLKQQPKRFPITVARLHFTASLRLTAYIAKLLCAHCSIHPSKVRHFFYWNIFLLILWQKSCHTGFTQILVDFSSQHNKICSGYMFVRKVLRPKCSIPWMS